MSLGASCELQGTEGEQVGNPRAQRGAINPTGGGMKLTYKCTVHSPAPKAGKRLLVKINERGRRQGARECSLPRPVGRGPEQSGREGRVGPETHRKHGAPRKEQLKEWTEKNRKRSVALRRH